MDRRAFSKTVASGLLGVAVAGPAEALSRASNGSPRTDKRPNFVLICSDQHSARYTGYGGHPLARTPNLDGISARGVAFSSAYCGSPLCVPGRSSLMTGMYASDVNSFCNSTVYDGSHPTWAKRLRDAGYFCWATGKMDLNPKADLGFEGEEMEIGGHARKPDITSLFRRPVGYRINEREEVEGRPHPAGAPDPKEKPRNNSGRDRVNAQYAVEFLKTKSRQLNKPWVAFVGLREPHPPYDGRQDYYDEYLRNVSAPTVTVEELERLPLPYQVMRNFKRISTAIPEDRIRRAIAAYFAMISELDEYIGEIHRALQETGEADNTYFIYTSDHGESLGEHGMWFKNNLYQGPANVPLVISGPGLPQGMVVQTPVGHVDLVATVLQLASVKLTTPLRGTSLLPVMEGHLEKGPAFVYAESHSEGNPTGSFMIRKGDWKLIHFSYYPGLLFNLKDDPSELRNRIDDPSAKPVVEELRSILRQQVDPEEVTERAFRVQAKVLDNFVRTMNEDELFELFRSRLGDGEARVMAKMLKARL